MSALLFPLEYAAEYLGGNIPNVERDGLTLRWPHFDGETELTIEQIDERTSDGEVISEVVTLTHRSPLLATANAGLCSLLNRLATLSALTPGANGEPTVLRAKVGIFSQDQAAAERLYSPLLCQEAVIIGWHAAHIGRCLLEANPDSSALRMTDEDPPYDQADYEALKARSDRAEYLGFAGERSYTVEFPWDSGARTRMLLSPDIRARFEEAGRHTAEDLDRLSGRTSLLTIRPETHPLIGRGLQCSLEIPLPGNEPGSAAIISELNHWELSRADLPPHFGAWCEGPRSMAYISFIPTQLCVPGLPHNLLIWSAARHTRAREWLEMSGSAH